MKRLCFLLIVVLGFVLSVYSQVDRSFERHILNLSPSDQKSEQFRFGNQHIEGKILSQQPTLFELKNQQILSQQTGADSLKKGFEKMHIATRFSNGKIEGDYLPDEGNAFTNAEIMARAVRGTQKSGTIFGELSFSKGLHKGYGWNAVRHAELYRPYLIVDSTGGTYRYENYYLSGAYAFKLKGIYLSVDGSFRGEVANKQTDPRSANTTTWLRLGGSLTLPLGNVRTLSLRGAYIRNKQHLDLWNWRPQRQDLYFITYGFGYYDIKESPIFFGIKRMFYVEGQSYQLTYSNLNGTTRENISLLFNVEYENLLMRTEESGDAKSLFGSSMHRIYAYINLGFFQTKDFRWNLILQTQNHLKYGREKIYENYSPDEEYSSIYDYRLIDIRKRYSDKYALHSLLSKLSYHSKKQWVISLEAGAYTDEYWVDYTKPAQHCGVSSLYPTVGLGVQKTSTKWDFAFNTKFMMKKPQSYSYNVGTGKFRMDYQMTFLPYAYHTDQSVSVSNELYLSRTINTKQNQLGVRFNSYFRKGNRPTDVVYKGIPQIQSGTLSTPTTDKVNNFEFWFNITLFYTM